MFLELIVDYLEHNKIFNKKTSKYILTILISRKHNMLGYLLLEVCFLYYNTCIIFYNIYVGVRLLVSRYQLVRCGRGAKLPATLYPAIYMWPTAIY
jgi:hypothetical protein